MVASAKFNIGVSNFGEITHLEVLLVAFKFVGITSSRPKIFKDDDN